MNKIVFLDIDGTLVGYERDMPESTKRALTLAKENGCYLALCTGRAITDIYPFLFEIPFDGIVASAGAYITCKDQMIFHHVLEKEKLKILEGALIKYNAASMFQGVNGRYLNETSKEKMEKFFLSHGISNIDFIKNMTVCENPSQMKDIESAVYFGADADVKTIQKFIDPYFKITDSSFSINRTYSGEITCRGIDKATGMKKLMTYMNIPRENSIAIGDGPNDVEMLQYAEVGVAMGNAEDSIKKVANMVTESISEDGIYHAFCKLGLLI